jgi:hypothetical protein
MAAHAQSQETASLTPVQALDRILEIVTGYCSAQAFVAGCKLSLFEELAKAPATAEDLAGRNSTGIPKWASIAHRKHP